MSVCSLQVHYMVAVGDGSADTQMWRTLRTKLNIFGRAVEGHTQGSAKGTIPYRSDPNYAFAAIQ